MMLVPSVERMGLVSTRVLKVQYIRVLPTTRGRKWSLDGDRLNDFVMSSACCPQYEMEGS